MHNFSKKTSQILKTLEGIRKVINISNKPRTIPPQLRYKNRTHHGNEAMAESFNDFFVNIGDTIE